ncbi:MAG: DUF5301 domain-containing protein [Bacteroidetes bacterium]|nr:DUF5301 domain-containing protein [Bacteroidota bacterium]
MKTKTIAVLLLTALFSSCNQPHRLDEWKSVKIPSIEVAMKQSAGNLSVIQINDEAEIKKIMDFLFNTRFKPYSGQSQNEQPLQEQWDVRLIFKGQHDQIYLYKDHALIGKSIYLVKPNVLKGFQELMLKLKS